MLKYLVICVLLMQTAWAKPLQQQVAQQQLAQQQLAQQQLAQHHLAQQQLAQQHFPQQQQRSEPSSHILIVTPQAHLHLESYPTNPYLQHLSPLTRFVTPNEETVVYVPTRTNPNSYVPLDVTGGVKGYTHLQSRQGFPTPVAQAAANAQQVIMSLSPQFPANFTEAANQVTNQIAQQIANANEAWSGVTGFLPAGSSPALSNDPFTQITNAVSQIAASTGSNMKPESEDAQKNDRIEYDVPVAPVLLNEPRHHYIITSGAVPQLVDVVQTPVFVTPNLGNVRGRSLQSTDTETPIVAIPLPLASKPEALPLQSTFDSDEKFGPQHKKLDYKRFVDANNIKDNVKQESQKEQQQDEPDHQED